MLVVLIMAKGVKLSFYQKSLIYQMVVVQQLPAETVYDSLFSLESTIISVDYLKRMCKNMKDDWTEDQVLIFYCWVEQCWWKAKKTGQYFY